MGAAEHAGAGTGGPVGAPASGDGGLGAATPRRSKADAFTRGYGQLEGEGDILDGR